MAMTLTGVGRLFQAMAVREGFLRQRITRGRCILPFPGEWSAKQAAATAVRARLWPNRRAVSLGDVGQSQSLVEGVWNGRPDQRRF